MGIVDEIYRKNSKRALVKKYRRTRPILSMSKSIMRLNSRKRLALIAEFKRASPSGFRSPEGLNLREYFSGINTAALAGISILSEPEYFSGSYADIENSQDLNLPILVKDFISTEEMVDSSFNAGGDCILLISDFLEFRILTELYDHALNLGMDVLIEFHDVKSAVNLYSFSDAIIGYNRRNLRTLEMDPDQRGMDEILGMKNRIRILESGINSGNIGSGMLRGFNGALIGSSILSGEDVTDKIAKMEYEAYV
ncbi:indole-3-glycerol-phosphate synthase [Oxyplasma meridianum]|uniref:Indole-3-glycerol phosphate synthase n=1 Tax=Oxyplasma meridianum TaxID=3073602 RepID=A0AAX4NEJ3_9ARCH